MVFVFETEYVIHAFKRKKSSCRPIHFKSDIYFNRSLQPPWFCFGSDKFKLFVGDRETMMIFTYINKGYIRTVIAVCYKFTVLSRVVSVKCFTHAVFGSVTCFCSANIRAGS